MNHKPPFWARSKPPESIWYQRWVFPECSFNVFRKVGEQALFLFVPVPFPCSRKDPPPPYFLSIFLSCVPSFLWPWLNQKSPPKKRTDVSFLWFRPVIPRHFKGQKEVGDDDMQSKTGGGKLHELSRTRHSITKRMSRLVRRQLQGKRSGKRNWDD